MKHTIDQKQRKQLGKGVYQNAVRLILVGCVTGVSVGVIVSFFNILMHYGEEFSRDAYAFVRANPAFLPLLLLTLCLGAFLIGVIIQFSTVARGCGIPQAEGATRGVIRFTWFRDITATFAACLLSTFMGLSIGAEGPSVLIGAGVGDGVSSLLRRNEMIKKYQITGGACAGLAVAANAPLTGIVFAFEEAHKRFTPEVFICAFSSVIFGVLARTVIYGFFNLHTGFSFAAYAFSELPVADYWYVALAAFVVAGSGVGFYYAAIGMRKLFRKIRFQKHRINSFVRTAIAVGVGGVASLVTVYAMGGGHELIEMLGSGTGDVEVFALPLVLSLLVILLMKTLVTAVNVGSGIPCGIFVPIIAIGACLGSLLNQAWLALGMDASYCDIMVMICLATFFTTIIRAPITAVIMICEFTGSFVSLLPVVIGVAIGYFVGELSRTDGLYEELLEIYKEDYHIQSEAVTEIFTITLSPACIADRREVRDILWPAGAKVTQIKRGENTILPDGDTVLHGGDILTVVCKTTAPQSVKDELTHIAE